MKAKPLASIILLAYNQENYIEEALRAAMWQSYEPLEIVVSDDASTDSTYDRIMAAKNEYRGPHRIISNRNQMNLGVCKHLNRAIGMSSGEILIWAAGDDVSHPERANILVETWMAAGKPECALVSDYQSIDENGKKIKLRPYDFTGSSMHASMADKTAILKSVLSGRGPIALGAAGACSRQLIDHYGPMPEGVMSEDVIVSFRAFCHEGIVFINQPLINYRVKGIAARNQEESSLRVRRERSKAEERLRGENFNRRIRLVQGLCKDVETAKSLGVLSDDDAQPLRDEGKRTIICLEAKRGIAEDTRADKKCRHILTLIRVRHPGRKIIYEIGRAFLPIGVFLGIKAFLMRHQ